MSRSTFEADRRIGERLHAARIAAGKTMSDLGALLGVSHQQYRKYETAQNRCPPARLAMLASHLGTTTDALLGMGGEEAPERIANNRALVELSKIASRLKPEQVAALTAAARAMTP